MEEKSLSIKQTGFIHFLTAILLLVGMVAGVYLVQHPQILKSRAQTVEPISGSTVKMTSYSDSVSSGLIAPAQKILEVTFNYDKSASPIFSFTKTVVKNGYAPKYLTKGPYRLEVLNSSGTVLKSVVFDIPATTTDNVDYKGKQGVATRVIPTTDTLVLTTPWYSTATKVRLMQSTTVIAQKSLTGITIQNNQPNFQTIRGDTLLGISTTTASASLPTTLENSDTATSLANGNDGHLDVLFISEDYNGDYIKFGKDVLSYELHILDYEPFRSNASKIRFHQINNGTDLQCFFNDSDGNSGCWLFPLILWIANTSGAPWDAILIPVNQPVTYPTIGDTKSAPFSYAIFFNDPEFGPAVALHELAHLMSLQDEYKTNRNATPDNLVHANCFAGEPPTSAWNNIVTTTDYKLNCNYDNWYRSSLTSLMNKINVDNPNKDFNMISKMVLSDYMSQVTGSSPPVFCNSSTTPCASGKIFKWKTTGSDGFCCGYDTGVCPSGSCTGIPWHCNKTNWQWELNAPQGVNSVCTNICTSCSGSAVITDYKGEYWNSGTGESPSMPTTAANLIRNDKSINFDWGTNSPGTGINADHFIARWTQSITFEAGTYKFSATSDDGIRVYIDGVKIIDQWNNHATTTYTATKALTAGDHDVKVEYYDDAGGAMAKFSYAAVTSCAVPPSDCAASNWKWKTAYSSSSGYSDGYCCTTNKASCAVGQCAGMPYTCQNKTWQLVPKSVGECHPLCGSFCGWPTPTPDPCPGQHETGGACNSACCSSDSQCTATMGPVAATCSIGNGTCQTNKSCDTCPGKHHRTCDVNGQNCYIDYCDQACCDDSSKCPSGQTCTDGNGACWTNKSCR